MKFYYDRQNHPDMQQEALKLAEANRFDHPIEAYDYATRVTQATDPAIRKIAKQVVKMYEDEISDIFQMTARINDIKGVQNSMWEPITTVQRIMRGMDMHLNPVIGQSSMAPRIHAQLIHAVSIPGLLGIKNQQARQRNR